MAQNAPKVHRLPRVRRSRPFRNRTPARKPMIPMQNICQGVHTPWENSILDTSMDKAPTRKPLSPPRATPEMMVIAITGLNWGSMKNAARPATEMAHSTAMTTSSRAWGRRPSNTRKNGAMHSSSTSIDTRPYRWLFR